MELAQKIIDFVRANPGCDRVDICDALGTSFTTLRAINDLIEAGTLRQDAFGPQNRLFIA